MVLTFHHIILSPKEEGEASNKAHDRDVDADRGTGEDAIAIRSGRSSHRVHWKTQGAKKKNSPSDIASLW